MRRQIEAKNALLEKSARTDHLTGLPNRMAVEEFRDSCNEACFPLRVIGEENPFVLLSVARVLKLHAKDVSVLCRRLRG